MIRERPNHGNKALRVLFIGMDYYHYPEAISRGLERLGYQVDYYPIEPKTLFYKTTRYILKPLYRACLDRYHHNIISQSSSIKYDKVFFIATHFFSIDNLKYLRNSQGNSGFISYHWDPVSQYNYLDTIQYFDRVYSFDKIDCQKHGFKYLPLFASDIYNNIEQKEHDIDIYTIGSVVNPQRYTLVQQFKGYCISNDINFYFHLKVTLISYLKILLKGIIPKDVSFGALKAEVMRDIVTRSRAVLDVPNHQQSGLTMRVIENICIGKKLVTTNVHIVDEPFYDKNQIFLLGEDNMDDLKSFIRSEYKGFEHPELKLESWLKNIFL
jgi:hypothetical protein